MRSLRSLRSPRSSYPVSYPEHNRGYHYLFVICAFLCITLCLTLCLTSCSDPGEKTFSKAGMSITLTDEFYENEYYNLTAHYEMKDEDVTVSATKEEFSAIEAAGDTIDSREDYAKLIMEDNEIEAELKTSESGKMYFTFTKTPYDTEYVYYAFIFETDDSYWLFQFGCESAAEPDYRDLFMKWADSVSFS